MQKLTILLHFNENPSNRIENFTFTHLSHTQHIQFSNEKEKKSSHEKNPPFLNKQKKPFFIVAVLSHTYMDPCISLWFFFSKKGKNQKKKNVYFLHYEIFYLANNISYLLFRRQYFFLSIAFVSLPNKRTTSPKKKINKIKTTQWIKQKPNYYSNTDFLFG